MLNVSRPKKPMKIWWTYAKAMIRQYPQIKNDGEIKKLSPIKQKEFEAVKKAIELTQKRRNAESRMQVIEAVLWNKGCTLAQAATRLYLSEGSAFRYHCDFILLVGECYGLVE